MRDYAKGRSLKTDIQHQQLWLGLQLIQQQNSLIVVVGLGLLVYTIYYTYT